MTDKLPPNLLALFAPRPALRWVPPSDHAAEERHTANIGGVAEFLSALRDGDDDSYMPTESWLEKRDREKLEKKEAARWLVTDGVKDYKPSEDPQIRGDAFKTLFITRLSWDTEQKDLEREFGRFGPIERVWRVVHGLMSELTSLRLALLQILMLQKMRQRRRKTEDTRLLYSSGRRI